MVGQKPKRKATPSPICGETATKRPRNVKEKSQSPALDRKVSAKEAKSCKTKLNAQLKQSQAEKNLGNNVSKSAGPISDKNSIPTKYVNPTSPEKNSSFSALTEVGSKVREHATASAKVKVKRDALPKQQKHPSVLKIKEDKGCSKYFSQSNSDLGNSDKQMNLKKPPSKMAKNSSIGDKEKSGKVPSNKDFVRSPIKMRSRSNNRPGGGQQSKKVETIKRKIPVDDQHMQMIKPKGKIPVENPSPNYKGNEMKRQGNVTNTKERRVSMAKKVKLDDKDAISEYFSDKSISGDDEKLLKLKMLQHRKKKLDNAVKNQESKIKLKPSTSSQSKSPQPKKTHERIIQSVKSEMDDHDFEPVLSQMRSPIAQKKAAAKRTKKVPVPKKTDSKGEGKKNTVPKAKANMKKTAIKHEQTGTPTKGGAKKKPATPVKMSPVKKAEMNSSGSESESDWEEVEDLPEKSQVPDKPVEITLEAPNIMKKKKKKEFDMAAYLQRQLSRYKKELRIETHKANLVCLVAHGFYCSQVCQSPLLQALVLSLIGTELNDLYVKSRTSFFLVRLTKWFKENISVDKRLKVPEQMKLEAQKDYNRHPVFEFLAKTLHRNEERLSRGINTRYVSSEKEMVLIFLMVLRCFGIENRLLISLQPIPLKEKTKGPPRRKSNDGSQSKNTNETNSSNDKSKSGSGSDQASTSQDSASKVVASSKTTPKAKNATQRKCASKTAAIKAPRDNDDYEAVSEEISSSGDEWEEDKKKRKKRTPKKKKEDQTEDDAIEVSSEEDFETQATRWRKSPSNRPKKSGPVRVISSDSDSDVQIVGSSKKKTGSDYWVECYFQGDRKWISVDCVRGIINKPEGMEKLVTQPISYVLAFGADDCVKDVTQRYASNWMSHTRKIRVDSEWWQETLAPYQPKNKERDHEESLQLKVQQVNKPLPTSIGEFKDHPLYALERHLLKFQAIYPPSSVPVGFIRGEAVYARECVHTLHSKQTWLKEARAVRVNEVPYKMVKSRPSRRRPKEGKPDEPDLPVFGLWQTEEYMPPPAYQGKVPRNEYGNVELFKPCMLPGGTVHLRIPGLNRVAKKLDIDCVAAMTGWDSHGGYSHPVLDGFIVCEEFKDILLAAWDEEQEIIKAREEEKREKRVLDNWKKLIKGILIKQRLKARFNLQSAEEREKETEEKEGEASTSKKARDMEMSWPRNRQDEKPQPPTDQKHWFEVEKL